MADEYPNIFSPPDGVVPLTKWDRDRIAAERAEADRRDAAALRDTRAFNPAPPTGRPLTAFERAQGRGHQVSSEPVSRAAQDLPDPPVARPPAGIPKTISDEAGLIDRGTLLNPNAPSQPPAPAPAPTRPAVRPPPNGPSEPFVVPDDYDPTGQRPAVKTLYGPGNRPIPPEPGDPRRGTRPPGSGEEEDSPNPPPGTTTPYIPAPEQPEFIAGNSDASFRPGPLPKKPVTPGGKGGGGAGGAARGARLPLGDQRRTEAYDPTLDRADPRNVGIIDDSGRTNPKLNEQAQKGAIDPTAPGVKTGEAAQKFTNQYTKALAGAAAYMEDMFHQKQGDPNKAEGYGAMTLKAVGAPDDALASSVFKVVDPNNELTPKERMELATRAMHDWYSSKGDTKNADKVAAEMLQYGNKQAQEAGKRVLVAVKQGDQAGAAKALQEAYDWLPDGMTAQVKGNSLVVTDAKGQAVNTIPLGGNMLQNLGLGLASGTLFWDIVQQRAGKPGTFAPPAPQPGQAIATSPPAPGASPSVSGASPPAGAAPSGPPAPQAAPVRPAQAPPPPSPARAGAPAAPPSSSGGPPASPSIPLPKPQIAGPQFNTPQVTPVSNRPDEQMPPPPPRPPHNNQSEAPAPAAPGPTNTSQAAPETAPVDQRTGEAIVQGDQPAIDTRVPPPLKGPVQPTTTKRPIVAGEEPPALDPSKIAKAPTDDKGTTGKKTEDKKQERFTYPDKDYNNVPIDRTTGKEYIYRRRSVDHTPEVTQAQKNIKAINDNYQAELKEYVEDMKTPGLNLKDKEVSTAVGARKKFIDEKHKADLKEQYDTIKAFKTKQDALDEKELTELKPKRPTGLDRQRDIDEINEQFKEWADPKNGWSLHKTNPLRLFNDEKKWAPIRNVILEVQAHNRHMSTDEVTRRVATAISHLESGPNDKSQTLNGEIGEKGARYRVIGNDLNNNVVIQVGGGRSATALHMPPETFAEIIRFKEESYKAKAKDFEAKTVEHKKAEENKRIRDQAFKPGDPYGTRKKSQDRWLGPGEAPPERP